MKAPIGSVNVESSDWQQTNVLTHVGSLSQAQTNGSTSTATLNAAGMAAISRTQHTQFRIYFNGGDDNDTTADQIGYYSGANTTTSNKPTLTIQYVIP
jgi:microcystin-dependent protein